MSLKKPNRVELVQYTNYCFCAITLFLEKCTHAVLINERYVSIPLPRLGLIKGPCYNLGQKSLGHRDFFRFLLFP